jgi:AraC-like DNA-binding protein
VTREASPISPRGILRRAPLRGKMAHARHLPAPALLDLVEHYWFVHWDLRGEEPFLQETLPHPSVHWVTERGSSTIQGVSSRRFTRLLEGRRRVFGVKFKPGGFYPFFRSPVASFANQALSLEAAFGPGGARLQRRLEALDGTDGAEAGDSAGGPGTDDELMDVAEQFLLARLPPRDEQVQVIQALVGGIMTDRDIVKVDDLVERFGIHKRALQRLFSQYIGASPKWVIQRYRLHEAVELVAAGGAVSWSRLAADLGYFDQTHFAKAFKALVGQSPSEYARTLARQDS